MSISVFFPPPGCSKTQNREKSSVWRIPIYSRFTSWNSLPSSHSSTMALRDTVSIASNTSRSCACGECACEWWWSHSCWNHFTSCLRRKWSSRNSTWNGQIPQQRFCTVDCRSGGAICIAAFITLHFAVVMKHSLFSVLVEQTEAANPKTQSH